MESKPPDDKYLEYELIAPQRHDGDSVLEHNNITLNPKAIGRKVLAITALVGTVTALGWGAKMLSNGNAGDVNSYAPEKPTTPLVDNKITFVSWNMHNETRSRHKDLKEIADTYHPDVIALQEVNARDAMGLRREFSNWYINFVLASATTKLNDGGYGNVLLTQQEPKDVDSLAMSGNSYLSKGWESIKGLFGDTVNADTSFRRTAEGTQEDRSAISEVIQVSTDEGLKPVRIATAHVGGDPLIGPKIHKDQFNKLKNWLFRSDKTEEATVLCMDSNGSLENTTFDFAEEGYITPVVEGTTVPKRKGDKGKAIDQCSYKPNNILHLSKVQVLRKYATDHFAILFSRLHR